MAIQLRKLNMKNQVKLDPKVSSLLLILTLSLNAISPTYAAEDGAVSVENKHYVKLFTGRQSFSKSHISATHEHGSKDDVMIKASEEGYGNCECVATWGEEGLFFDTTYETYKCYKPVEE